MSTDIVAYNFSTEQLAVMKATVAQGTSPAEFALFLEVCKHRKLNPFNREIYVLPRKGGGMTFQVSIDGLRLLAERSGKYQGQIGPLWCGKDGEWKEVWLADEAPAAAKVGVLRSDFKEPIFSVAKFKSYAGTTPIWSKMPDLMLAKCAESLALRRAFPDQMAGLYTHEEMSQAENDLPAQVLASETVIDADAAPSSIDAPLPSALRERHKFLGMNDDWETVKKKVFKKDIFDDDLTPDQCITLHGILERYYEKQAASGK